MRILTYQAKTFGWTPHHKTLAEVPDVHEGGQCEDCVVVWLHAEVCDESDDSRVFRHVLKHIKWIANKRKMVNVVLHSFAHLGGETASAAFAQDFIGRLNDRLPRTGYRVHVTPFGYFCAWHLDVYGDSLAKVYKEIKPS